MVERIISFCANIVDGEMAVGRSLRPDKRQGRTLVSSTVTQRIMLIASWRHKLLEID
jgi:hypothetical protein